MRQVRRRSISLYVNVESKVTPKTLWYIAMGNTVLFILGSTWLSNSAMSGVNRVQVVLSGFGVRLLCFDQAKLYVRISVWLYVFPGCIPACLWICNGAVISCRL